MVGPVEAVGGGGDGGEPVATDVKTSEEVGKHGAVNINPRLFAVSCLDKETVLKQKKKQRRRFSHVVRAVLFETSLAKKIKRNKILQKLHSSNGNQSVKFEKGSNPMKKNSTDTIPAELPKFKDDSSSFHTSNSTSSLLEQSPSFQPISSEYKQQQQEQENLEENGKGFYSYNTGLYLLLLSLFGLVLFGKSCAVLCISAWLYYLPRWNTHESSLLNRVSSPDIAFKGV